MNVLSTLGSTKRAAITVMITIVIATANTAWACPACAAGTNGGTRIYGLLAALIAVPYVVAAFAFRTVRRIARAGAALQTPSPPARIAPHTPLPAERS